MGPLDVSIPSSPSSEQFSIELFIVHKFLSSAPWISELLNIPRGSPVVGDIYSASVFRSIASGKSSLISSLDIWISSKDVWAMEIFRGESCTILIPYKLSLGVLSSSGRKVCYKALLSWSDCPLPCNILRSTVTFYSIFFLAADSLSNSSRFYRISLPT